MSDRATIDIYVTDHQHSKVVSRAFAQGCNGRLVSPVTFLTGGAVCYGILRGCGEIINQCQWIGRDFYHIDHGYFKRGHYDGYYRVTKNAFQQTRIVPRPADRFERLGVDMKPWRKDGDHIVVIPLTGAFGGFLGIDTAKWTETVVAEISRYTDRPVIVKPKDGTPLRDVLRNAHCLVTHTSNAATDAVVEGIPVVTLGASACLPVSTPLSEIEHPNYPDRTAWANALAYSQFTLDEMRNGVAWEVLRDD